MGKQKNYLTYVRDTYGGSWPRTLVAMSLLVIWTHATTHFLFDVEWFDPMGLLGAFLVGGALAVLGRYLSRKYPPAKY